MGLGSCRRPIDLVRETRRNSLGRKKDEFFVSPRNGEIFFLFSLLGSSKDPHRGGNTNRSQQAAAWTALLEEARGEPELRCGGGVGGFER